MEHPIFLKHDNTEILFPDKKLDKLFLFFFFMQSSKDSYLYSLIFLKWMKSFVKLNKNFFFYVQFLLEIFIWNFLSLHKLVILQIIFEITFIFMLFINYSTTLFSKKKYEQNGGLYFHNK